MNDSQRKAIRHEWYLKNREAVLKASKEYHKKHKDDPEYRRKRREFSKEYRKQQVIKYGLDKSLFFRRRVKRVAATVTQPKSLFRRFLELFT